jgi:hypothetical protein
MSMSWSRRAIPYQRMLPSVPDDWFCSLYPHLLITYYMVSISCLQCTVLITMCFLF